MRFFNVAILLAAIFSAGCSEVDFAPGDAPENIVGSESATESFLQKASDKKVDILFVVDNSSSMYEDQNKLGQKIQNFLQQVNDIDWQLAITTTDVSNGPWGLKGELLPMAGLTRSFLKKGDPNAESIFLNTVVREETNSCVYPACPDGDEQPIKAALLALGKQYLNNSGFIRADAELAIVILSDEDEFGGALLPTQLMASVSALWGSTKRFSVFAIIIQPGDFVCLNAQKAASADAKYGSVVAQLAQLTKGAIGSICDLDYGQNLKAIGQNVRKLLNSFRLADVPFSGSLKVSLSPAQPHVKWRLEGRFILFDTPPAEGTIISVDYSK